MRQHLGLARSAGRGREGEWRVGARRTLGLLRPSARVRVNGLHGGGITGACGCTPDDPCVDVDCGVVQDTCGNEVDCGACPPLIQFFDAEPSTIDPGQSATLSWEVTGADFCSISPTVGPVPCDDFAVVTPETSTTYQLEAEVAGGPSEIALATVEVRGTSG